MRKPRNPITTADFLKKLKERGNWNEDYNYDKVVYVDAHTKVIIVDENGFDHILTPNSLLNGSGLETKNVVDGLGYFIFRARKKHGDKYDYSLIKESNIKSNTMLPIVCKEHGLFYCSAANHLQGRGCHNRKHFAKRKKVVKTTEDITAENKIRTDFFLQRLKDSGHWNDKHDYSKVLYEGKNKKIIVVDENGLDHEIIPSYLLNGSELTSLNAVDKTEYYLQRLKDSGHWNNDYDYSKLIISWHNPVIVIDENGFEHEVFAGSLLDGSKLHPKSVVDKNGYFKFKAKQVHGDRYDYSLVEYTGDKKRVKIICHPHGVFEQMVMVHLGGANCPGCNKITTDEFIVEAREVHGDRYDYSLAIYIKADVPVPIICRQHGVFMQSPNAHIGGKNNCPICVERYTRTIDEWIEKAREVHDDRYDYSKVSKAEHESGRILGHEIVTIICKEDEHGEFMQRAHSHLRGQNCSKCTGQYSPTTEEWIKKAKLVHGERYAYDKVIYINTTTRVTITCTICKEDFDQLPGGHLNGHGCPSCAQSKGEATVEKYLVLSGLEKEIDFFRQKTFDGCEGESGWKLRFDFFIPQSNICIEYDGAQHFHAIDSWGGEDAYIRLIKNDGIKNIYCEQNGIKLVRIPYTEFDSIESIISNILLENKNAATMSQ